MLLKELLNRRVDVGIDIVVFFWKTQTNVILSQVGTPSPFVQTMNLVVGINVWEETRAEEGRDCSNLF